MYSIQDYIKQLKLYCKRPISIFDNWAAKGLLNWVPDKWYLSLMFRSSMGYWMNWKHPKTFNEKLQWLKIHDRNPLYTQLVDKYEVRKYITKKIGDEYLIPLLGVWDKTEDIDFDNLPNQFVLKCTHDSGSVIICKNKRNFDFHKASKKLSHSLKQNYYNAGREWPYKNIKPRIIAEQYQENELGTLPDYKFFCVDGYVDNVMVCIDREKNDPKYYFFDEKWNLKRINKRGKEAPEGFTLNKPQCISQMFRIASELSKGYPFVRIDLYEIDNKIYFGEQTFYPAGGFDYNLLQETDIYFGKLINLKQL